MNKIFLKKWFITFAICAALSWIFESCNFKVDPEYYESWQYRCEYVDGKYVCYKTVVEWDSVILRLSIEWEWSEDWVREWKWTYYYNNWKIDKVWNYKDSKKDWRRTYYYDNWAINMIWNYKNWKEDGKRIKWYLNWRISEEWNYKDWKKVGTRTYWYKNWSIQEYQNYDQWDGIIFNEDWKISSEFLLEGDEKLWIKHREDWKIDTIPL